VQSAFSETLNPIPNSDLNFNLTLQAYPNPTDPNHAHPNPKPSLVISLVCLYYNAELGMSIVSG